MTVQMRFKLHSPYNEKIMNAVAQYMKKFKLMKRKYPYNQVVVEEVYDCPIALDTEATKYLIKGSARGVKDRWFGFMYIWMIKFGTPKDRNSIFIYGRTLKELDEFLTMLSERMGLGVRCEVVRGYKRVLEAGKINSRPTDDYDCIRVFRRRLDIYVHNLGYDIQHLMNILQDKWDLSKAQAQYDAIPMGVYLPKVSGYSEKDIQKRADLEDWQRGQIDKELLEHPEIEYDENGYAVMKDIPGVPTPVFSTVPAPPRMEKVKQLNSDSHRPIYHEDGRGFRFRDSLILSMQSLKNIGEDMKEVDCDGNPIVKLSGDLDYSLIRTPETPLTEQEMKYCQNDVEVLTTYIEQQRDYYKGIMNIPDTNTGRVRSYLKEQIFGKKKNKQGDRYKKIMKQLRLTRDEYVHGNKVFMGGYTHANSRYIGNTLTARIRCDDFTSSYPGVMLVEVYPNSKEEHIGDLTTEEYYDLVNECLITRMKGCMATLYFKNLSVKPGIADLYLPSDTERCEYDTSDATVVNGRIARTGYYRISVTEVDFQIIFKCYNWEKLMVKDVRVYGMDYLPSPFIRGILNLYADKTTLKNVEGKEIEYGVKKAMLNSSYGMTVTRLLRDLIEMDANGWNTEALKIGEELRKIEKENDKETRFTYYLWGVYVTAYARRNLWSRLLYVGPDEHIYTDTDSSYDLLTPKLDEYMKKYNEDLEDKKNMLFRMRPDLKDLEYMFHPKDKEGIEHPIGEWDYDGEYDIFKTLGSKKYMKHGWNAKGKEVLKCTVAGIKPECLLRELIWKSTPDEVKKDYTDDETGRNRLMKVFKSDKDFQNSIMMDMFEIFDEGLTVKGEYTGKLTPVYDDRGIDEDVIDYLGNTYRVEQQHGVALIPTEFTLDKDGSIITAIRNGLKIIEQIDSETAEDGGIVL